MKVQTLFLAAAVAAAVTASHATAAVSDKVATFGKGPAAYLMLPDEINTWKSLENDAQAQQFIDFFWARRDPTPGTPRNEFREEFDRRVAYADKNFRVRKTPGSMTDRGMVLIVAGPPKRYVQSGEAAIDDHASTGDGEVVTSDSSGRGPAGQWATSMGHNAAPTTIFVYEKEAVPAYAPGADFSVTFTDVRETRDFKVDPVAGRISVKELLDKARASYIYQPNLTLANYQQAKAGVAMPAPTPTPAMTMTSSTPSTTSTSFKNPAFATAVSSYKAAASSPYKGVYTTYGEFVTPGGEYFVPVQLYFSKDAGVKSETPAVFFGQVEDSTGKVVAVYEEPAVLAGSKKDVYFDKSIVLPSGKYTGYFGAADESGKILGIARNDMTLSSIDKTTPGTSHLILTDNLFALPKAQMATDPFAFGGLKVVPKSDRTFSRDDELDYFVELRNPGVDPATGKPNFQAAVTIEDEKGNKRTAPPAVIDVQPVKGVEGHYWVGSGYGVSDFSPGKYKLKLKLIDMVSKAKYELEEPFRVLSDK